jgi:D-mannonate dehydratase
MNQKYLTIYYEDDLEDEKKWQATSDKIFNYLNLESMPVHSNLKKTYDKPYSELITNYDELIECIQQNGVSEIMKCNIVGKIESS